MDASLSTESNSCTLFDLLETRAARGPSHPAFTFLEDGEHEAGTRTFAELAREARGIGAWLTEMGLAGERVVLLFPPGLEFLAAFFGCIYAGAIAIPAPAPNPSRLMRTLPRLQGILADARPAAALTSREGLAVAASAQGSGSALRWLAVEDCPPDLASQWRRPDLNPSFPAHLQYTSGSTSSPKGTVITHSNVIANSRAIRDT
jgi:acyl-CoA synthetase (AMP-forming)/AMP-acid ligase II